MCRSTEADIFAALISSPASARSLRISANFQKPRSAAFYRRFHCTASDFQSESGLQALVGLPRERSMCGALTLPSGGPGTMVDGACSCGRKARNTP